MLPDVTVAGWGASHRVFHIVPFGDVHYDTSSCARDKFKAFLRDAAKLENPYFIGMGDYLDFASHSERKALVRADLHETTRGRMDAAANADLAEFVRAVRPAMHGRVIGLLGGNHDWTFADGTNSTQRLAQALGAKPDRAWGWLCCLNVQAAPFLRSTILSARMVFCHGKAGGKLAGTTVNQVDQLRAIFPGCSIYAMGHDHRRGGWPVSSFTFDRVSGVHRLHQLEQWLVRTGSFKKAYKENSCSYEAHRLLPPASLGGVVIEVRTVHTSSVGQQRSLVMRVLPL